MIGTPELVFFGIQAAVKLARAGRRIYVEDTAGRELVMPLPAGFTSLPANARQYAEKLARDPATKPRFNQVF